MFRKTILFVKNTVTQYIVKRTFTQSIKKNTYVNTNYISSVFTSDKNCKYCKGTGVVKCMEHHINEKNDDNTIVCYICKDDGYIICYYCGGTGFTHIL